jgi:hypothetical protein
MLQALFSLQKNIAHKTSMLKGAKSAENWEEALYGPSLLLYVFFKH